VLIVVGARKRCFVTCFVAALAATGCGTSGTGLGSDGDAGADGAGGRPTRDGATDATSSGDIASVASDASGRRETGMPSEAGRSSDAGGADVSLDSAGSQDGSPGDGATSICDPTMTSPVALEMSSTGSYRGVAVDDTWVYFTGYQLGLARVPKAGGALEHVPQFDAAMTVNFWEDAPSNIAIDAHYVYWLVDGTGVARSPTDSTFSQTAATLVASVTSPPWPATADVSLRGLAVDATATSDAKNVYYGNIGAQLVEVPVGAAGGSLLMNAQYSFAYNIAADADGVFWASDTSGIFRGNPGGNPVLVASGYPWDVALDTTNVYWTDTQGEIRAAGRSSIDGGAARTLTTGASPGNGGIAVDDQFVYWGDSESADAGGVLSLRKVSKAAGGDVRILATGVAPSDIATDATCIYYVDDAHVMRVSKWAGLTP
jgi:hypothetical protein